MSVKIIELTNFINQYDGGNIQAYVSDKVYCEFIKPIEQQLKETQEKLKHYETGFKGACATCENVGELNLKLSEKLKIAIDALKNLIDKTEYGVNQWQKAWSPDKETEGQKAIKKARQALEKIKEL